jgi:hypothetical protein
MRTGRPRSGSSEEAVALHREGSSINGIAGTLGTSRRTVYRLRSEAISKGLIAPSDWDLTPVRWNPAMELEEGWTKT